MILKTELLNAYNETVLRESLADSLGAVFCPKSAELLTKRILRIRNEKGRMQSMLGWILASGALKEAGAGEGRSIFLDEHGKPELVPKAGESTLYFSITHSGHFAAAAASLRPIGIDCEQISVRTVSPGLSKEFGISDKPAFLRNWCAREAYLKMTGEGIGGIKNVTVDMEKRQVSGLPYREIEDVPKDYVLIVVEG